MHTFQEKGRKISNHLEKQRGRKIKVKGEGSDARREEQRNDVVLFSSVTESSLKNTGGSLPAPKSTEWQELKSFKCRLSWMFLKSIVLTAPSVYPWKKTTVQPTWPVSLLGDPEGRERGSGFHLRRRASQLEASPTVARQGNAGRASLCLPSFSHPNYSVHATP